MHRLIDFKPWQGLVTAAGSFTAGILPETAEAAQTAAGQFSQIQSDTVFIFQIVAFTVTIVAGILTGINAWMRFCKNRKQNERD